MRVSTSMIYEQGVRSLGQRQESMFKLSEQLSTSKRINRPSDDPVGAARVQSLVQSQSRTTSFTANGKAAASLLGVSENQIGSAVNVLQDLLQLTVQAGNGALSDADRLSLSVQAENGFKQILSIANSDDGNGVYLYSGLKGTTRPFVETTAGVVAYVGDQGTREMQIDATRSLPVSDNGNDVFMRIRNGNGDFVPSYNPANTGSGVIDTGSVTNAGLLTGHNYQINFTVVAGVTQYSVTDTNTATVVVPATTYKDKADIGFDGMTVNISGQPANGDSFTVVPSSSQSVFTSITQLVQMLKAPIARNPTAQANAQSDQSAVLTNLQGALENILKTQTAIGARQLEIDSVKETNDGLDLQYSSTISQIQDLDYTKALSDFMQAQTTLQAAQQTFQKVQGMSLFNYI